MSRALIGALTLWLVGACQSAPHHEHGHEHGHGHGHDHHGAAASARGDRYDRPGFATRLVDDRIWVWRAGEPQEVVEDCVTLVKQGPDGRTVKATDSETAVAYVATRPGFAVRAVEGRVWVWRAGEPQEITDKSVTRVNVSALGGRTVKATDAEVLAAYLDAL